MNPLSLKTSTVDELTNSRRLCFLFIHFQMMKFDVLLVIGEICLRLAPVILDTGIQIWNAVEVDIVSRSCQGIFSNNNNASRY